MAAVTATSGADLLTTDDVVRRSKLCKQLVYRAIHTTDPASFPAPSGAPSRCPLRSGAGFPRLARRQGETPRLAPATTAPPQTERSAGGHNQGTG
jgi:hypothetical protein